MTNETSDGLREAITKLLRDDPVCCGRVSLATIGDIAALSHPTPAFDAAAVREAFIRLLDAADRFNGVYSCGDKVAAPYQGQMILAVKNAYRVLGIGRTEKQPRFPEAPASVEASSLQSKLRDDIIYLTLCAKHHADSFPVPSHMLALCDRIVAALADHEPTSKTVDDSGEAVGCQQEAVAWRPMETIRPEEYVLLRFDGPFHDTECPGVAVGKLSDRGGYWLTAIWASSTPLRQPSGWMPLRIPTEIDTVATLTERSEP